MRKILVLLFSSDVGDAARIGAFLDTVEGVIDWRSDIPNSIFLASTLSAHDLSDRLTTFFEGKGRHLVSDVKGDRKGWLAPQAWNFLNQSAEYDPSADEDAEDPTYVYKKDRAFAQETAEQRLAIVREQIGWSETTGSARKWWEAFEKENEHRPALVLRLAEELADRQATIKEFFLAYVYSNTDNILANLHYLDYRRLKTDEERKRKEAADATEHLRAVLSALDSSEPLPQLSPVDLAQLKSVSRDDLPEPIRHRLDEAIEAVEAREGTTGDGASLGG